MSFSKDCLRSTDLPKRNRSNVSNSVSLETLVILLSNMKWRSSYLALWPDRPIILSSFTATIWSPTPTRPSSPTAPPFSTDFTTQPHPSSSPFRVNPETTRERIQQMKKFEFLVCNMDWRKHWVKALRKHWVNAASNWTLRKLDKTENKTTERYMSKRPMHDWWLSDWLSARYWKLTEKSSKAPTAISRRDLKTEV